ncbi:trans-resveratrol di-O-methyltransferase-like [Nicotiana tabacum]|uniref:Trans-resveratrol di-O-methyltransferase-like n=3 Tax=Nicotiana tabacum TaxID=4097 RepID=A0AC58UA82_TOBAC|nr:PREDICTED: trans-resveratrol di-O-methyltransferase-like [Nicotiana tabacum]
MEAKDVPTASEMFRIQAHIYKHTFHFANSMVLRCAIQLGIPDIVHTHKQPMTLSQLVSELKLPSAKSNGIHRLMRLLVYSGFFATKKLDENSETQEGYVLTASSKLLLKSEIPNLSPFARVMVDPIMVNPWQSFGDWFLGNEATPFETAYGTPLWKYCDQNPGFNKAINEAMASDSEMMSLVVKDCKQVFEEMDSLVDVGGGTGVIAKTILGAFPHLKCTVLDLPHVVANIPDTENLKYVGGDMFQSIPPADAFLFKLVMHDWSDEDCVKMLKRCREAMRDKNEGRKRKVIIIDIVVNGDEEEADMTELKLIFDVLMMVYLPGRERTEKEWEKLFLEAGFMSNDPTGCFMSYCPAVTPQNRGARPALDRVAPIKRTWVPFLSHVLPRIFLYSSTK